MIGCAGTAFLCAALIFAPYVLRVGSLAFARWRWAQNGGRNYTVVVSQFCYCYVTGAYKLTVRNGHVTAVELIRGSDSSRSLNPAAFDHLTVEAALDRADRAVRASWLPDWQRPLIVEYDPVSGYVTRYQTGDRRVYGGSFLFAARDLHLSSP